MTEEENTQNPTQEQVEDELDDESENLPFPNARVVKIIKSNLVKEHQLKKEVKEAANILLGDILKDIAKRMDDIEYHTLSIEHFNSASRKYREIEYNQKRLLRIKKLLEKQRAELDEVISEIELEYGIGLPTEGSPANK